MVEMGDWGSGNTGIQAAGPEHMSRDRGKWSGSQSPTCLHSPHGGHMKVIPGPSRLSQQSWLWGFCLPPPQTPISHLSCSPTLPLPPCPGSVPAQLPILPQRSLVPPGKHGPMGARVQGDVLRSHFQLKVRGRVCDAQPSEVCGLMLPRAPGLIANELPIH